MNRERTSSSNVNSCKGKEMGPVPRCLLSHCQKESFKKNIHVLPARPAYARNVNFIYFFARILFHNVF